MSLRSHGDTIAPTGAIDFATNLWPAPPAPALTAALTLGLAERDRYPDEEPARRAIAQRHGRTVDEVLLLNGACEAFWLLAHTLRPIRAACVHPGFTEPEAALRAAGANVEPVWLSDGAGGFRLDPDRVPEDAELVVVGNPNNPTGTLTPPDRLAALARSDRWLVVDESFMEFLADEARWSLAERREMPGLVVVRSATKLLGLAGIRCGYLLGSADLVARLTGQRQPWSVNALACRALEACASGSGLQRRVADAVAAAREALLDGLRSLPGIAVWASPANFVLLQVPDGPGVASALLERGIAVRPAASFPGLDERFLRVAVRTPSDNGRLLDALAEVL